MPYFARLALAASLMLTLGSFVGHAQPITGEQRGEIEKIIRQYLLQNPEVLQEAIAELEKKQAAADAEKHEAAVKDNAATLFESKRQVTVGNPQGDVTFVEFRQRQARHERQVRSDEKRLEAQGGPQGVPGAWPGLG
jgi:protein-disulfide isomerase